MSTGRTATRRRGPSTRLGRALLALGVLLLSAILIALAVDRIFVHDSSHPAGTGSGVATTQARSLPPFSSVDLTGDNNVIVRVGAGQSVTVHADNNLLRRVTTRVHLGRLVIGTTPGSLDAKTRMFVEVNMPSLDGLRLQGNGNIIVTGIDSQRVRVALPGRGNIQATGTTTRLDVAISGQGNALLRQLTARDANAALSGDGTIMLTATHSLTAAVSGSGAILYGGNPPHLTQRVTGNGTVSPG